MLAVWSSNCSRTGEDDSQAVKKLRNEYTAEKIQMKRGAPSTYYCDDLPVPPGPLTPEKVSEHYTHCTVIEINEQGISDIEDGSFAELGHVETLKINFNHLETIRRGMWRGLNRLDYLVLSDDGIVNIEPQAWADIPQLDTLQLSGNKISEVRSEFWEGNRRISYLGLYNNSIRSLSPGVFKELGNLRYLSLGGNLLTDIVSGTFHGLGLEKLWLDSNQLTELRADMWQGLDSDTLWNLDVSNNSIWKIEAKCFGSLRGLTSLDLSHNPLRQISVGMFEETRLTTLYLTSTGLTKLNQGIFRGDLSSVNHLHLEHNDLEMTPDMFQGLTNVIALYLENCKISKIRPEFWNGLELLTVLHLKENRLESIGSGAFQNLRRVYKIDIQSNKIKRLAPQAFSGLSRIKDINLKNNELTTLDQNIFDPDDFPNSDGHPSLMFLVLEGNPIECNESLDWMIGQDWLDSWELEQTKCADHPDMTLDSFLQCVSCGKE